MSTTERCPGRSLSDEAHAPPVARRRWLTFAVVAIGLLMASIDQTAVATALPAIGADLGSSLAWSSWTITVYALGQIIAMPVCGRLCEQFGRKRLFVVAVAVFTLASATCGLADHIAALVGARAVQGIAAGAILPAATGLVADSFGAQRDRAVGMFTTIFPVGAIVGPIVGGVLVSVAGWRSIFMVNVLPGVVLCLLAALVIRERRQARERQVIDWWGIALLVVLFLSAMTAAARLGTGRLVDPLALGAVGVAAGALAVFVRHIRRDPAAVIPARLVVGNLFGRMNVVNVVFGASAIGFSALVPLYAELRYGIGPLAAGGLLTARAVGMIGTSGLSVWLMRRTGQRVLISGGFGLIGAGLLLLAVPVAAGAHVWLMVAAGITGLGMGMAAPAANNAVMHLARGEIAAVSGLRGMFRQSGAIVTVSLITAIGTASSAPADITAWAFVALAGLLLAAAPLVLRVPDRREGW
ncbi:MFS transporter [Pseudonocardia sp. CA-107938]|uniref:MFS transporter n=1 Tax=Pseudonocardia sp. CA-107938 TaxID=3240021 RepID=UPI003D946AC1